MDTIKRPVIKLISDEDRRRMLSTHSPLFFACQRYKEIEGQLATLEAEKAELKEKILKMSEGIREQVTEATSRGKEGLYMVEAMRKRNIKFKNKNGFINYCKNAGLNELVVTTQDIDKKKYYQKFEQGLIPLEIAEAFTEVDYSLSLKVAEE